MHQQPPGTPMALLQLQLLQKTEALQKALAEGKPADELKALFTECSELYDALMKLASDENKD